MRSKLDEKSVKLSFVGYSEDHKGYRFLDRSTHFITISRDARFIELNNGSEQSKQPSESDTTDKLETTVDIPMNPPSVLDPRIDQNDNNISVGELEGWCDTSDDLDGAFFRGFDEQSDVEERAEPDLQRQDRRTRGVLPERYNDFVVGIAELTEAEPTS
ncbi:uncharacterized protein LOC131426531 [Malaya genurostris]|uniref:uncharacterized protein LOC131426531 n=1 Tax=Malaya genurostris TaxID=325434 RepID=UPI0026F3B181|nr:uncharacterized protein LOC131426531 [Malaya genurostris]